MSPLIFVSLILFLSAASGFEIGDFNEIKMQPGLKHIVVYIYQGTNHPDTEIGRVYEGVDLSDQKFHWKHPGNANPRFRLNQDTGSITMIEDIRPGIYELEFYVYDQNHTQLSVQANVSVTVTVKEITHEAFINAGSIRIAGTSDEDFIRRWDYRSQSLIKSKAELFRTTLAQILATEESKIDVFSVQQKQDSPEYTDIRFSAYESSSYYKNIRLNGFVLLHREEIEKEVGINITMVGIDECLYEHTVCGASSCTNRFEIGKLSYTVNTNSAVLVGVRVDTYAECICGTRNFGGTENESCRKYECYNGGKCIDGRSGPKCVCPKRHNGPRCQISSITLGNNDWAWYPPLETCDESHLSLEFVTKRDEGLILYNGPMVTPELDELILSDFISIELEKGEPRLLIDFGSGTLELKIKLNDTLADGEWHRIDVFWDNENVRMVLDFCKTALINEADDGSPVLFDTSCCQVEGQVPPFNEHLNVNTPLQIGGMYVDQFDPTLFSWQYVPTHKHFTGCIRNLIHNSKIYDLANSGHSRRKTRPGCVPIEKLCAINNFTAHCSEQHEMCVGSFRELRCECEPGWMGPSCGIRTVPTTFQEQSYIKYALSFEPDRFLTLIQLRFRTRETNGEMFRVSDLHNREYGILEIRDGRLRFRFNLNRMRTQEIYVWLSYATVDDGQWHTAKVSRHGSVASLELDGGEGKNYNETFKFSGHQWLEVDRQEGVYAGGKAEYTGRRTFEVYADYQKGCLDDIRLEGKHLPLPPSQNRTQGGQASVFQNLKSGCFSNGPFGNVTHFVI